MISPQVTLFEVQDRVVWITLNRPEAMNSLNPQLRWELSELFTEVEQNDDIWMAVVTGAGEKAFSAGADLKHRAVERDASAEQRDEWRRMGGETLPLNQRWHFPKPVIAMVNGYALGGGLELAMSCDIIVCADHAELGLPEPRRGLIAGGVGVHRLPRQIGLKPAMGYLLTGRHMKAERAYQLGLVNEVVPLPVLREAVDGWVADILRCAPLAVRATKEATMRGLDYPLAQAFVTPYESEQKRVASEDAQEGPKAFAEKRPPNWKGI
ncbi:MAG: enoyl-CoA hydratase-related protein [Pseudomonadales bacterium]|jgi:crotonobetainyl-CoA hydratase/dehydration protein DpgD|nr:enoyl-CoA hydratase-related protein [Pseudomonadales bacterium]MDP7360428.1 enoyl-CoA hydratase-related protein [Pseudomonadales bacterium]MDP7594187.1 enoyl-CoA hydratase-related protein [Pseudomonadales bacterium]HJN52892.1 enoyl-CoA hydratase-related protein [Pseudomonadales bacterium]|tara:strand:+ start:1991 stop:2791 length:801 start_codon:yes stop_codon:yes gene_type:complete